MATFNPPTDDFVTMAFVSNSENQGQFSQEKRIAGRLCSRIIPSSRGRNIYLLTDGSYTDNQPALFSDVSKTYYGGHDNVITSAEAASLTAAGYGAYIS
jgi:hypothetical protein